MRWLYCVLLAGCLPELDDAVVVKGRHLTVHAHPNIPICPSAIAAADRFVEDTAAMLGIEPPAIDYYLFDGETGCGYGPYAKASCAINGSVFANHWIHFHELVHAVDDSHPPALFVEGFAEALSTPSDEARRQTLARADVELDLDSSAFRAGVPWENYQIAGAFVRYVVERFGAQRYRRFALSVSSLSDRLTIRRQFRQVFDVALDDVIAAWRDADPRASSLQVPVDLTACLDPIAPTAPDAWTGDGAPLEGCTSGRTANATTWTQYATRFGFEVSTPGLYAIQLTASDDAVTGRLRSCSAARERDLAVSTTTKARVAIMPLGVGRHAIETVEDTHAWSVARLGAIGDSCATATPMTAPDQRSWEITIRGRPGTWIRVDGAKAHRLRGRPASGDAPARACAGLCEALRCEVIAWPTPIDVHDESVFVQLGESDDELATFTLAASAGD